MAWSSQFFETSEGYGSASLSRLLSSNGGFVVRRAWGLRDLLGCVTEPTGRLELPTGGLRNRRWPYQQIPAGSFISVLVAGRAGRYQDGPAICGQKCGQFTEQEVSHKRDVATLVRLRRSLRSQF